MPSFTRSLRVARESETLIDQAAEVVETKESTDPTVINDNAQFEAEIARLKAKTDQQGSEEPSSTEPETPAEPAEPSEPSDEAGSDDQAGEGDDDNDNDDDDDDKVDEDSFDKAAQDAVSEDAAPADLDEAAQKPPTDGEHAAALESFNAVMDRYRQMINVHETGRIQSVHVGLCSATMNRVGRRHSIETPAMSLESGDGILARVAEFIRQLIAKVKESFKSLYNWISEFLRGYKAASGRYESTKQGMNDRLAYMESAGITVTDEQLKGKNVKVGGLSNYHGNEIKDIGQAVTDLSRFADVVQQRLLDKEVGATVGFNITTAVTYANAGSSSLTGSVNFRPISTELVFGKVGELSKLGDSSYLRDNVEMDGNHKNGFGLTVKNLIGGYDYSWTLEENNNHVELLERAENLRKVDFRQTRNAVSEFEVPALTPAAAKIILSMADQLNQKADALVDTVGVFTKLAEGMKNNASDAMQKITKFAGAGTITEQESFIMASIIANTPDVYTRITVAPTAKLIAHLRATADSLMNWCILSTKVVDEVIKKN